MKYLIKKIKALFSRKKKEEETSSDVLHSLLADDLVESPFSKPEVEERKTVCVFTSISDLPQFLSV